MDTTCYCCSSKKTSKDHVPPRCFFAKNKKYEDLMTVPSCDKHNMEKSNSDEYLKFVFSAISINTPIDVINSTVRGVIRHMKKNSKTIHKYGITKNKSEYLINQSFEINIELICECFDKIAKGIYYDHNKGLKKINKPLEVYPIFLEKNSDCPIKLGQEIEKIACYTYQEMKELPMHGNNQEIFSYQIIEDQKIIVINMLFYKDKVVSAMCLK